MTTFTPAYITGLDINIPQGGQFVARLGVVATQLGISGPTVARNTAYTLGQLVTPVAANGYAYECSTAGTTHSTTEPTWPTVVGKTVSDGTAVWRCEGSTSDREYLIDTTDLIAEMEIREGDWDGDTILEGGTSDGRVTVGFSPGVWEANTAYVDGQWVIPTLWHGIVYEAVVAGTSHGATEPTWPTTMGATVTDGTVTWRAEHVATVDNGMVSNVTISLDSGVTAALSDWGRGTWNLDLTEAPDTRIVRAQGVARLLRENTY
jgi:hypothetical protein